MPSLEVQMLITYHIDTKRVEVECPMLHDKVVCYGILERAKDAVRVQGTKEQKPNIEVVTDLSTIPQG